jgi:hypothetical protein
MLKFGTFFIIHTKSSAVILILPTALEMASKKDVPGPTYQSFKYEVFYSLTNRSKIEQNDKT